MFLRRIVRVVFAMVLLAAVASPVGARSRYVDAIPNGAVFECANCHVDPGGGGTRTTFGNAFSANGDVWTATLANKDSDGDGWSNGVELQDVNGTWQSGQPNPGNSSLVANPGSNGSVPPVAVELVTWSAIKSLYRGS
jgi:hypothetical protein